MKEKNRLYEIPALREVSNTTLDKLWEMGSVIRLPKNKIFMRAKEPAANIYIILSGKVIVYNLTSHGKRKIIFVLGKGNLVNENVVRASMSSIFADTIEESTLFTIETKQFLQFMEKDFDLTLSVLRAQERKLWRMGHQLKNTMGSIYMERKLAAKLWKLARDFGKHTPQGIQIDISMTVTFLADLMGAPRETISRLCSTLVDYGLITMEKRRITVIDPKNMVIFYKEGVIPNRKEA